MFAVALHMEDMPGKSPAEAASLFLSAITSGDWTGGMHFIVKDDDGKVHHVILNHDDVTSAINWSATNES